MAKGFSTKERLNGTQNAARFKNAALSPSPERRVKSAASSELADSLVPSSRSYIILALAINKRYVPSLYRKYHFFEV